LPSDSSQKIKRVEEIFAESGSAEATSKAIEMYSNKAFAIIDKMNVSDQKKELFIKFGHDLMQRKF
jgi:geranylgeranyl diphosphate synthase type II